MSTIKGTGPGEAKIVAIGKPRVLGSYVVPHDLRVADVPVGGLSGIDRDHRTGQYLLISDDQSQEAPARFYTAEVDLDENGIHDVRFTGVHFFRRPDGRFYPSRTDWTYERAGYSQAEQNRLGTVDPEDIRVDPRTGNVVWSHEGLQFKTADGESVIIEPAIRVSAPDGTYLHDLATPRNETFGDGVGPRENRGLEGVTFAQNGELVVSVLESSLRQDGPESSRSHGSLSRITVQRATGELVAQYAYPLDALPDVTPVGSYGSLIGISAILASEPATATRFLLIERAYVSGYNHRIRIYEADCTNATDVASLPSLVDAQFCPAQKRLLADLGELGVPGPPNFEGMTWAPELPTGERVLLLISDNDFRETLPMQFLALAVPPEAG